MSSDPLQDSSSSPAKSQPQAPTPQRVPSSAFKARLAAFESGAASNSSSAKYDAATALAQKGVLAADMGNLRSRFDKEGDKPLVVKGSFGLGATAAAATGSASKEKAVTLGGGRAAAPASSPTAALPDKSPLDRLTSSTSGNRPIGLRSDSTHSTTSWTVASNISTGPSLLPDRVASLLNSPNMSSALSEDASMGGLRTPMSSVSLSSLQVESGSLAGDSSTDRGSVAAAEERSEPTARTPGLEDVKTPDASPFGVNPSSNGLEAILQTNPEGIAGDDEVEDSAAQLARKHGEESAETISDGTDVKPPEDAVQKAAEELAKYSLEEPSKPVQPTLLTQPSLDIVSQENTSIESDNRDALSPFDAPDRPVSPAKSKARPGSYVSNIRRSSTNNSIKSSASQPEADLADIGLDNIDSETSDKLGITQSGAPPAVSAGPDSPPSDLMDEEKAQHVAESLAPPAAISSAANASDAPIASSSGPVTEVVSPLQSSQDDLSHPTDEEPDVPQAADESAEVDEDGMPLVKCSDCASKVSLMQLGEHACAISPSSKLAKRQSLDLPEDVLVSDSSVSPTQSPSAKHKALSNEKSAVSSANVPSNSLDSLMDDFGDGSSSSVHPAEPQTLPSIHTHRHKLSSSTDNNDADEYMTALTSRADSVEDASPRTGSPYLHRTGSADEEDDTEELASFAVPMQGNSINNESTPRKKNSKCDAVLHPDSPTPDQPHVFSPSSLSIASPSPIRQAGPCVGISGPLMPLPPLSASSASSSIDAYDERMSASPIGVRRSFSNNRLPSAADGDQAGTATIIQRVG